MEEVERAKGLSFAGTGGGRADCKTEKEDAGLACLCLSARSPIFAFLNDMGMRLTRISMRVRRPCAWRLYCARNFRARSVTMNALALGSGLLSTISDDQDDVLSSWRLSMRACF